MDTSREYIKMCDCPEIQLRFEELRDGNSFYANDFSFWLPRQDQLQKMINFQGSILIGHIPDNFLYMNVSTKEQLYAGMEYGFKGKSMEQLWLAFIMEKKFNKRWDGKEWK